MHTAASRAVKPLCFLTSFFPNLFNIAANTTSSPQKGTDTGEVRAEVSRAVACIKRIKMQRTPAPKPVTQSQATQVGS